MCGIAGYVGSFSPDSLLEAGRRQEHRGPDSEGVWHDVLSGAAIGSRRLAILDPSPAGTQPMADDEGSAVLVFNGEIFNFRELRGELVDRGHRFHGESDTEVLLHLYLEHGERMLDRLDRLNGIFAFAVWDTRSRSMFLARDAFGVKPLYYSVSPAGFAFASEIKALLALVPDARELDLEAIDRYLTFLWCPAEGTPLRGVRKLMPGEAMIVRAGRIERRWAWYRLPVFRGVHADLSERDAIEGTARKLREAVQRQLVSDVPVGAFLSGGLDSSSVVAFARQSQPGIPCFTIEPAGGSEPGTADDLPYARRVAKHLDVPLEVVRMDARRVMDDFERAVVQMDEPLADPAALNVFHISELARRAGVKVLLSGAGGDDLFTGYRRHTALRFELLWRWLPSSVRSELERISAVPDKRSAIFRRSAKLFNGAGLDGDARLASYFMWGRGSDLRALYAPSALDALKSSVPAQPMLEFLEPLPPTLHPLDRMLALEQRFFLADHNLIYTDKMSMAAGVEARVPFLDLDVAEFAARIPLGMKQRGRTGKWVLKKAMEPYLPKDVIYRPKSGFGAPLRRWIRSDLRPLIADVLSAASLKKRALFDPAAVQRLIERNDRGEADGAYTLFSLLSIEVWCRAYLDRRHEGAASLADR